MSKKFSRKRYELELQAARAAKKAEFLDQCLIEQNDAEEVFGKNSPFGAFNVDNCVSRRMSDWELGRKHVPTGKYRDEAYIRAAYQKEFFSYIQKDFPNVIEDLKNIIPQFQSFFGDQSGRYNATFDRYLMEPFFENDNSFTAKIAHSLDHRYFSFREGRYNSRSHYKFDYLWGEYRLSLLALSIALDCDDSGLENLKKLISLIAREVKVFPETTKLILETAASVEMVTELFARESVESVLKDPYFATTAQTRLARFFEGVLPERSPNLKGFLILMLAVLDWAEKYRLEKDWVIRYSFFLLHQLSENDALKAGDIEIPQLDTTDLQAENLEFDFSGWNAGLEYREDYQKRVESAFREKIVDYFDQASRLLKLEELTTKTNSLKFERVRWLVISVILNLRPDEVLDWLYKESYKKDAEENIPELPALRTALTSFHEYDLPLPPK